jgi:hypothetical protein
MQQLLQSLELLYVAPHVDNDRKSATAPSTTSSADIIFQDDLDDDDDDKLLGVFRTGLFARTSGKNNKNKQAASTKPNRDDDRQEAEWEEVNIFGGAYMI